MKKVITILSIVFLITGCTLQVGCSMDFTQNHRSVFTVTEDTSGRLMTCDGHIRCYNDRLEIKLDDFWEAQDNRKVILNIACIEGNTLENLLAGIDPRIKYSGGGYTNGDTFIFPKDASFILKNLMETNSVWVIYIKDYEREEGANLKITSSNDDAYITWLRHTSK